MCKLAEDMVLSVPLTIADETCHGSGSLSPASHCGGPGSVPGQSM